MEKCCIYFLIYACDYPEAFVVVEDDLLIRWAQVKVCLLCEWQEFDAVLTFSSKMKLSFCLITKSFVFMSCVNMFFFNVENV